MARYAQTLSAGSGNTEHLSVGALALCFPLRAVQAIIEECGRASRRVRDPPAAVAAYYVIGMSLFPSAGYEAVLDWLLGGLRWLEGGGLFPQRLAGKSSLSRARQRLGEEPMRLLFERLTPPLKDPALKGSHWKDLCLVAMDGSTLALQDTASNTEAFGRPGNQNGEAGYPQCRFVALVETGTHLIFGARLGAYNDSEITLAGHLLDKLRPGMLCLADRLFAGLPLWKKAAATGAHLLWRAKTGLKHHRREDLPDGSWLARWEPSEERGAKGRAAGAVTVRVIEYRLQDGGSEVYRLITTLLDPVHAPARELAALYPRRWEIELTFKEGKSVLRQGQVTLRSKTAELVRQEFRGLLLAHHMVRRMMAQAAMDGGKTPDKLSFTAAVEIIKSQLAGSLQSFSP